MPVKKGEVLPSICLNYLPNWVFGKLMLHNKKVVKLYNGIIVFE